MPELPRVKLGRLEVSRLLIGGNPFSGISHQHPGLDQELLDYYTTENIKKALARAQQSGINAFVARADRHFLRVLRECHQEGRISMHWVAQTVPELADFRNGLAAALSCPYRPAAIYFHGGLADSLWQEKKLLQLQEFLQMIKDTGVLCELAAHLPETIEEAESQDWPVDFYLTCFYNPAGRGKKGLTVLTGSAGEYFDEKDPFRMAQAIQAVKKPCLAYKVLAAGRKSVTPGLLKEAFRFAYASIKPGDAVVVGVFQKYRDQIAEDVSLVREILSS